ncbi:hypothetical protein AYK26_02405 [Euryarchaeota archaeon SM23-78]|nr:MAG: hypothetical protein AYK26_02405 [Euryarchaeota archaeon SM23-78]MBW3001201.1 hypothetical protein [Candidatus Woesearchaeota archaeon]
MLEEKRIQEAKNNMQNYLREDLVKKTGKTEPEIKNILVNNSRESLKVADILYKNDYSSLWTIVCSYYAMYYIANAIIYNKGYKIGHKISHKITSDALIVYIRKDLKDSLLEDYELAKQEALEIAGIKADELIETFELERVKRSRFQYSMTKTAIRAKAKTSLERAKRFVFEMEKLMG